MRNQRALSIRILSFFGFFMAATSLIITVNLILSPRIQLGFRFYSSAFLYTVGLFVSSIGIFILKNWGRVLMILILVLTKIIPSLFSFVKYLIARDSSHLRLVHLLENIVVIIISTLVVFFLTRKSIKEEFNKTSQTLPATPSS